MSQAIDPNSITIGQWATYFDTGLWTFEDGNLFGPEDLTIQQLKDYLLASGGAVYLHKSGRFAWIPTRYEEK